MTRAFPPEPSRRPPASSAAASRAYRSEPASRGRVRRAPSSPRRRLHVVVVVLVSLFALVGARLVDMQARNRRHYVQLGLSQRVHTVTLAAERGSIFDRNGNDLALSVSRSSVWADPRLIKDPAGYATQLAPIVGVDAPTLEARLSDKDLAFVYVARQVEKDVAAKVKALDLPGVAFVSESKRYYPAQPLAAPLLGWVGIDNDGLGGLEASEESVLAGKPGKMEVEQDAVGRDLPDGQRRGSPAVRGGDLVLTIDESLQFEAERVLSEEVARAEAKGGMVVIADVRTGDILAMATVDGAFENTPAHPAGATSHNRPLTDVFEPGSTAKVVTIAAALEAGLISPSTVLNVPSIIVVDGEDYADVQSHPTAMTVADIVRESSNVGTILIADQLGRDRFDAALRGFGFGTPTGLDFPGEAAGILLPVVQYNATSMTSMPVGSGIAVTAMQMLDVYLTIANDGVARAPRLVMATIDGEGERHEAPLGETRQVVSVETARAMRTMLAAVVASGTGTKAQIAGYQVGGKTGTARKPPYDTPPYKYVASFAGFAPVDSPRLAAIVVLDEPSNNYTGGQVAAPVFARIMQYALAVEHVPAG
ncbi:MAG: penicillin-binding protein 2 [Acidimicrobiia bacterium]|nr:penicillin-binding protein 2 [Acidimicrobiia bacterium]